MAWGVALLQAERLGEADRWALALELGEEEEEGGWEAVAVEPPLPLPDTVAAEAEAEGQWEGGAEAEALEALRALLERDPLADEEAVGE